MSFSLESEHDRAFMTLVVRLRKIFPGGDGGDRDSGANSIRFEAGFFKVCLFKYEFSGSSLGVRVSQCFDLRW